MDQLFLLYGELEIEIHQPDGRILGACRHRNVVYSGLTWWYYPVNRIRIVYYRMEYIYRGPSSPEYGAVDGRI